MESALGSQTDYHDFAPISARTATVFCVVVDFRSHLCRKSLFFSCGHHRSFVELCGGKSNGVPKCAARIRWLRK